MMPKEVSHSRAADSPLAAFDGIVVPNQIGALYRAALAVVAFAMVLLPVIYMALIGLTAWAVWYHLAHNTWIMPETSIYRLMAYLGPAVAGFILVFFMIKPFFAAREQEPEFIILDLEKEPLLFAFVRRICDLIGAPMPSRVDVNCEVNASASLRRGLWSRDLVLTIGLPLVAGLDMRQFAGVLAHEFGHFAQGYGMRVTYVIRHFNAWFARVVYERDAWDARLEQSADGSPWQIGIVLHAARACVWITRRILWALMHVGHAISCFMLRQMEYDADSYGAKLVGGDALEGIATQIRVLNAATHFAYQDVQQCWASRRLPENLVLLIDHKSTSLPAEIHQEITATNADEKTGWFDTHPCDADRLCAVRQLNESGIFHSTEPAARLFSDFAALSKTVTRHQYEKHFKLAFTDQDLISADDLLRESTAIAGAEAMVVCYYGTVRSFLHPLLIDRQLPAPVEPAAALAEWRVACGAIEAQREEAQKASAACIEHLQRRDNLLSAYHLAAANFQFSPEAYGLPDHATSASELRTAAEVALPEAETAIDEHLAQLEPFFAALRQRIGLALTFHANSSTVSPLAAEESAVLVPLLVVVGAEMKEARATGAKLRALTALAQNRSSHPDPSQVDDEALKLASDLQRGVIRIKERVGSFTYPFAHPRGHLTIAEYLRGGQSTVHGWQRSYEDGMAHVNRLFDLHHRLLGRVLALADLAEKALDNTPDCPDKSASEAGAHESQVDARSVD
jgi:Zn-dependent protease with chaperone function